MSDFVKKLISGVWHSTVVLVDGITGLPFSSSSPLPISAANAIPISASSPLSVVSGIAPTKVLTAQTALNTVGTVVDLGVARANHSLFVVGTGTVAAGVVTLLGSNDGVTWYATTVVLTALGGGAAIAGALSSFPFRYLTAKITTAITGGGTIDAWVASV